MIKIVKVFGDSGAEKSLIKSTRESGFQCRHFDDISILEISLKNEYAARYPIELEIVETEIRLLEAEIDKLGKTIESRSLEIKDEVSQKIKSYEEEIDELRKTKFSLISMFSFLKAKITLHNKRKLLKNLNLNPQNEIDKLLEKEYSELQTATNMYNYLKNNKIDEVNKRMKQLYIKIENITRIIASPDYSGAIGELEVIKNLENLPDDYYLLNDVFLEFDEYIRFDNSYLKSAQIDHLVIGSTGVYVIETKNWSAEHVQEVFSREDFTPYDQIRRGNYLLYKYLNDSTKIKSIIAIHGARIPPREEYTRVVRTNELSHHIRKGYKILSPEDVNEIVELFIHRVNIDSRFA